MLPEAAGVTPACVPFREQDGLPSPLGFAVWLFGLAYLAVGGLVGPDVNGEPLLPRPFGIGICVFLFCCWLAALIFTLRSRRTRRSLPR